MYNNFQINVNRRYLDVYNDTSPNVLVRYIGIYQTPNSQVNYRTLSFGTNDHLKFTFPDNAINTTFIIQMFNSTTAEWRDITQSITVSFPGTYCYRVSGTLATPQVNSMPCPPSNYIDVYNSTSPNTLVRYGGVYRTPTSNVPYRTLSFETSNNWRTEFPDNAVSTTFIIQMFESATGEWKDVTQSITLSFPGNFCYKVSGNFDNPQVNPIPCPNSNNLNNNNNICCNNGLPKIC